MIRRKILPVLEKYINEPETMILIGSRQVGKTFLMKVLQENLENKGERTIFLNLDVETDKHFLTSQHALVDYLRLKFGNNKGYVFIDEIQRKENAGLFLKGIYDMTLPYKFIVSGSGSLDIKAKIKESMAGRKRLFHIDPISFEEFANFKTHYQYETKLANFFAIDKIQTRSLFEEYMMFGGYPNVVLADTIDEKRHQIDEIYKSYIERDITDMLEVEKPEALTNLLIMLASQVGSIVNINELSNTIDISAKTVQRYLWYLEQTFIIKRVSPFYRNKRSEIVKAPIYYFYDTGLRNNLLGLFNIAPMPPTLTGHLFENVLFNLLRSRFHFTSTTIHFWRTRDNAEVDFIIDSGLYACPIEAKYTQLKKTTIPRSFKSFISKYKPKYGYIAHLGEKYTTSYEGTQIELLPYYELIFKDFSVLQGNA